MAAANVTSANGGTSQQPSKSPSPLAGMGGPSAPYRPLNVRDALSYLDEVKVQFSGAPEVYNRFLDIMKDFKTQSIDTPGVIDRVSSLFRLHPALIQGFNTFLPPGYRIDFYCPYGSDPANGTIYVTTPTGTTASKPGQGTNLTGRFPPIAQLKPELPERLREKLGFEQGSEVLNMVNQYREDPNSIDIFAMVAPLLAGTPDLLDEVKQYVSEVPVPKASRRLPSQHPTHSNKGRAPPPMSAMDEPPLKKKRTHVPTPPLAQTAPLFSQPTYAAPHTAAARQQTLPSKPKSDAPSRYETSRQLGFAQVEGMAGVIPPPSHPVTTRPKAEADEIAFFDRIARYIDDRATYHEFLKLCNLFTQDIIDLHTLVERAHLYLRGSTELWLQFRNYVGWRDDRDDSRAIGDDGVWRIENIPVIVEPEAILEEYGPSYRRLPESERMLACSGRDQLCWDVLNDQWVSAPTWTSEEGFLATKKNQYEEALQRSEEDRFEYDYHIDAVQRTIALLEPLAARIAAMEPEERTNFRLKPGLGGQSKSIYPTVLKKIYGAEIGLEIISAMHENPCVAVPIVLARIKQKEEEWRRALRDWKPVWRDIDVKNHYKALDYQGAIIKAADKKLLVTKSLVSEIETIRREQQQHALALQIARESTDDATTSPRHQLAFAMPDRGVLFDALRLVLTALDRSTSYTDPEKDEIEKLLRELVQHVFAIPDGSMNEALLPLPEPAPVDLNDAESDGVVTDADTAASSAPESTAVGRGRRRAKDRNALLKQAIDRTSRRRGGIAKDDSPALLADEETLSELTSTEINPMPAHTEDRPVPADAAGLDAMEGVETVPATAPSPSGVSAVSAQDQADEAATPLDAIKDSLIPPDRRLNVFCGSPLYAVLRVLQVLHSRLLSIKDLSPSVQSEPVRFSVSRVADGEMTPYDIVLDHCQRLFSGELDTPAFEDAVRATAGIAGYPIYTVDKVVGSLLRMLQTAIDPNGADEERAEVMMELLAAHRARGSGPRSELSYRQRVEGAIGALGENVYRIEFIRSIDMLVFQLLGKDELDEDDEETAFSRWEQYIVSFVGRERTEGFESVVLDVPILSRHLQLAATSTLDRVRACSGLGLKFCIRSLKIFYESGSEDWLYRARSTTAQSGGIKRERFAEWLDSAVRG